MFPLSFLLTFAKTGSNDFWNHCCGHCVRRLCSTVGSNAISRYGQLRFRIALHTCAQRSLTVTCPATLTRGATNCPPPFPLQPQLGPRARDAGGECSRPLDVDVGLNRLTPVQGTWKGGAQEAQTQHNETHTGGRAGGRLGTPLDGGMRLEERQPRQGS